jgi:hypothetical protein
VIGEELVSPQKVGVLLGAVTSGQVAAFVQQRIDQPNRGHPSVLLTAHLANGDQQPQLAVDSLAVAHVGNR